MFNYLTHFLFPETISQAYHEILKQKMYSLLIIDHSKCHVVRRGAGKEIAKPVTQIWRPRSRTFLGFLLYDCSYAEKGILKESVPIRLISTAE